MAGARLVNRCKAKVILFKTFQKKTSPPLAQKEEKWGPFITIKKLISENEWVRNQRMSYDQPTTGALVPGSLMGMAPDFLLRKDVPCISCQDYVGSLPWVPFLPLSSGKKH